MSKIEITKLESLSYHKNNIIMRKKVYVVHYVKYPCDNIHRLISSSDDKTIHIYNLQTKKVEQVIKEVTYVYGLEVWEKKNEKENRIDLEMMCSTHEGDVALYRLDEKIKWFKLVKRFECTKNGLIWKFLVYKGRNLVLLYKYNKLVMYMENFYDHPVDNKELKKIYQNINGLVIDSNVVLLKKNKRSCVLGGDKNQMCGLVKIDLENFEVKWFGLGFLRVPIRTIDTFISRKDGEDKVICCGGNIIHFCTHDEKNGKIFSDGMVKIRSFEHVESIFSISESFSLFGTLEGHIYSVENKKIIKIEKALFHSNRINNFRFISFENSTIKCATASSDGSISLLEIKGELLENSFFDDAGARQAIDDLKERVHFLTDMLDWVNFRIKCSAKNIALFRIFFWERDTN